MQRLPSLVKGAGFRSLSRRGTGIDYQFLPKSRVQISPSAPLHLLLLKNTIDLLEEESIYSPY